MARTGSQWRHLPDEYGKWNSVFRRWVEIGVFEAFIESLSKLVERDRSADMVDSTVIRAHHCVVGLRLGSRSRSPRALSRRLLDQNPRTLRRPGLPARLCPHT
jgi:transposase